LRADFSELDSDQRCPTLRYYYGSGTGILRAASTEGNSVMDSHNERRHVLAQLLIDWQTTADEQFLESLLRASADIVRRTARAVLIRHGFADPAAVEDAVTLVLDHLRRLPGASTDENAVTEFCPRRLPADKDPGEAYIVWLSKERARDVARRRHARARHVQPLAEIESAGLLTPVHALISSSGPDADTLSQLYRAIDGLQQRQAYVIRMLITGQSQAEIATKLKVCEGTVSRLRTSAIAKLREILLAK
jgi:DNA-binding CsgD family transcriptional regulator